jgi:hypothetical protein
MHISAVLQKVPDKWSLSKIGTIFNSIVWVLNSGEKRALPLGAKQNSLGLLIFNVLRNVMSYIKSNH